MRRKTRVSEFVIAESGDTFRAVLVDGEEGLLDWRSDEARRVVVRGSAPKSDKLLAAARDWADRDERVGGATGWLNKFIASRQGEIAKELHAIRKSVRRLETATRSIKTAEALLRSLEEPGEGGQTR
ncbi:MAG: hypothetical protein AB7G10_24750 [Reyranellaceae bacterium]